jgi:hypothetical protein
VESSSWSCGCDQFDLLRLQGFTFSIDGSPNLSNKSQSRLGHPSQNRRYQQFHSLSTWKCYTHIHESLDKVLSFFEASKHITVPTKNHFLVILKLLPYLSYQTHLLAASDYLLVLGVWWWLCSSSSSSGLPINITPNADSKCWFHE